MPITLPTLLTLSRIVAIPAMVGLFFIPATWAVWTNLGLYCLAAITDYLDGMLARRLDQTSVLGRFLDPIADKLLVAALLLMLVATGRITGLAVIPAVIILLREVLISGLREFLAGIGIGLPVSGLAKWKTAVQMIAIGVLIIGDHGPSGVPLPEFGTVGLWLAAVLTVASGWTYLKTGLDHLVIDTETAPAVRATGDRR